MNCDKILVMEKGEVAEFDTLDNLKQDPDSVLSRLIASVPENEKLGTVGKSFIS